MKTKSIFFIVIQIILFTTVYANEPSSKKDEKSLKELSKIYRDSKKWTELQSVQIEDNYVDKLNNDSNFEEIVSFKSVDEGQLLIMVKFKINLENPLMRKNTNFFIKMADDKGNVMKGFNSQRIWSLMEDDQYVVALLFDENKRDLSFTDVIGIKIQKCWFRGVRDGPCY